MSYIPSHAMPHAYVHEDEDGGEPDEEDDGGDEPSSSAPSKLAFSSDSSELDTFDSSSSPCFEREFIHLGCPQIGVGDASDIRDEEKVLG